MLWPLLTALCLGKHKEKKVVKQTIYEPIMLTDLNYEKYTKDSPCTFLMTYMDNVSFCTDSLPKFRAVGEVMHQKCQFAVLDCQDAEHTKKLLNITSYPSFHVIRNGKLTAEYTDIRNTSFIMRYVKRITSDPVTKISTEEEASDFVANNPVFVLLSGEEVEPSTFDAFKVSAALLFDRAPFVWASTTKAAYKLCSENPATIRVVRLVDDQYPVYDNSIPLSEWVAANIEPKYFNARNGVAFRDVISDPRLTIFCFTDTTRKTTMSAVHASMKALIESQDSRYNYLYGDIEEYKALAMSIGFTGTKSPLWSILRLGNGEIRVRYNFPENQDPTPQNLVEHANRVWDTLNPPPLKSENETEEDSAGPAPKLVGQNFHEHINDTSINYITLFQAGSDSAKAKALEMIKSLATEYEKKKENDVKFFWIDIEKNEIPGLKLPELKAPAFVLWPAGKNRRPSLLPEGLNVKKMLKLIEEQTAEKAHFKTPTKIEKGTLDL